MLTCQFTEATWYACVYDYQALVAGVLALGAAGITAFFLWLQIRQQRKFRKDDLRRRLKATRALLSQSLGKIIEYTNSCEKVCDSLYYDAQNPDFPIKKQLEVPEIDPIVFTIFRDFLECADEVAHEAITLLIQDLEVQNYRLKQSVFDSFNSWQDDIDTPGFVNEACERMIETAELNAKANSIVRYARGYVEEPEQRNETQAALGHFQFLGHDSSTHPELFQKLEDRLLERQAESSDASKR